MLVLHAPRIALHIASRIASPSTVALTHFVGERTEPAQPEAAAEGGSSLAVAAAM